MLPEEFERLNGTVACDETGRPLVLHHGTFATFERFERTSDIGFHFGTVDQARWREEEKGKGNRDKDWRIVSAALAVKRPLVMHDDPRNWDTWAAVHDLAWLSDPNHLESLRDEGHESPDAALQGLRKLLLAEGYDSIVYRNMWEASAKTVSWAWVALDPDAIVMLGSQPELRVLEEAVGDTSLGLETDPRKIMAIRSRLNEIKYPTHARALLRRVTELCIQGGHEAPKYKYPYEAHIPDYDRHYEFEVTLADVVHAGSTCPKSGHMTLRPANAEAGDLRDMIDHCMAWDGFKPNDNKKGFTVEWQAGESIDAYFAKVERMASKAQELIATRRPALKIA